MPRLNNDQVKRICVAAGFKLRRQGNGTMDLNPYVYKAAEQLIQAFCRHPTWLGHSGTGRIFCAECGEPKEPTDDQHSPT